MKIRLERQKLASEQDLLDRLASVATMAGTHEPQCLVFGVLSLSLCFDSSMGLPPGWARSLILSSCEEKLPK